MNRSRYLIVATVLTLLIAHVSVPRPAAASELDPAARQSMEQVIEQYIRAHPEVIEQSLQALEAKREAEEKVRQKVALAAHQHELLNDPTSPASGNLSGDITLVEFFDYRCGYCKRAAGAVTQLQHEDPRVRVIYKDFPILGEASELAAKAALASKAQGKHQAFHEAMCNPEWQHVIDTNRALARSLGISGTPGFIVGTELVPGALDLNGLKDLIARAGRNP
jgi:protein-disulfide isomerase